MIKPEKNPTNIELKGHSLALEPKEEIKGDEDEINLSNFETLTDDTDATDPTDCNTLLNILLCNPKEFEHKTKPSGVRKNFMCTLDSSNIPIESCKADDNGAYGNSGTSNRIFKVTLGENGEIKSASPCRKDNNGRLFINKRSGRRYIKENVDSSDVYELTRTYRHRKANQGFVHILVTAKRYGHPRPLKYYISMYRWEKQGNEENFFVPRHGNTTKSTFSAYYRADDKVLKKIKENISMGKPCSQIYEDLKDTTDIKSVSEEVRNPKQIYNIKHSPKPDHNEVPVNDGSEVDRIIEQIQSSKGEYMQSLTLLSEHYCQFNYWHQSLVDIERFCVKGSSVLRLDTTFEVIDGLWLTDTSYTNLSLLDDNHKHPEFPGPNMIHFKKDTATYRRFAGEMVIAHPVIFKVKEVGTDLDPALYNGVGDILQDAEKRKCLQHIMERDAVKLAMMNVTIHHKKKILADIYGSEQNKIFQDGLVDADDQADLEAKFVSLKDIWDTMVPGFYNWFKKKRIPLFVESVIRSPLDRASLGNSFYNNRLEVLHKLQKKKIQEEKIEHEVCQKKAKPLKNGQNLITEKLSVQYMDMVNISLHLSLSSSMLSPPSGSNGVSSESNNT